MRSPKARTRPFSPPGPQGAAYALYAALLAACGTDPPKPQRVVDIEPVIEPRVRPERKGPFTDPNTTAPPARSGAQQTAEALEETLTHARALVGQRKNDIAIQALRACANKVPQSIECEAELALLMFAQGRHKAHARYFMAQAANANPATAGSALYRRLGERAVTAAQFDSARLAYGILLARDEASIDDLVAYARALQADPNYRDEAVDIYAQAYKRAPTRHEFLKTQGTLLAQAGSHQQAAELFAKYRDVGELDDRAKAAINTRIQQLKALATTATPPSGAQPSAQNPTK